MSRVEACTSIRQLEWLLRRGVRIQKVVTRVIACCSIWQRWLFFTAGRSVKLQRTNLCYCLLLFSLLVLFVDCWHAWGKVGGNRSVVKIQSCQEKQSRLINVLKLLSKTVKLETGRSTMHLSKLRTCPRDPWNNFCKLGWCRVVHMAMQKWPPWNIENWTEFF